MANKSLKTLEIQTTVVSSGSIYMITYLFWTGRGADVRQRGEVSRLYSEVPIRPSTFAPCSTLAYNCLNNLTRCLNMMGLAWRQPGLSESRRKFQTMGPPATS